MNILGLVQLCHTSPVGGYSRTFGVEQLIAQGRLTSAAQLEELVMRVLGRAVAPADGVASGIAFRAVRTGAFERLPQVCAALSSHRIPPPMRLASVQMGLRLWGLSRAWDWAGGLHAQLDDLARRTDFHHAVAFGTLVSEATAHELRAIAACLFSTARQIVLAAVERIPLPQIEGQRILSDVQPAIAHMAAECLDKREGDIRPPQTPGAAM